MKKLLPKSVNNPKGFTLVELLVVISIIAILSVIGIVVFTGLQRNARDARRRADIQAISKAWEAHYSPTSPRYPQLIGTWFPTGVVPEDSANINGYTSYLYYPPGANKDSGANTYYVCAYMEKAGSGNDSCGGPEPILNHCYCIQSQQ